MKVLHITPWYPNKSNSKEALFIQRQITSLSHHVDYQKIVHLSINPGRFQLRMYNQNDTSHYLISLPFARWFIVEIISILTLAYCLIRYRANQYDVINFHIAYPNLTYWHWIKRWIRPKVIITEHWSAYHLNFGLKNPPPRIQKIFQQRIPVIAVSNALLSDIRRFSNSNFKSFIVPNIVDKTIFKIDPTVKRDKGRFFMVAQWKEPKDPFIAIQAFKWLTESHKDARLIIGGYGPQMKEMHKLIVDLKLESNLSFRGQMDSVEIAKEMQKTTAYLHCSGYETFSVVCAEALHCGCPVIASNVGGIKEFVNHENGILVENNDVESFSAAMHQVIVNRNKFVFNIDFSEETIGAKYYNALDEISK